MRPVTDAGTKLKTLGAGALCTAMFACGFATFLRVQHSSDMSAHIFYAEKIRSVADLTSPHFLFQLLLKAAVYAAPLSYTNAAVWILGLCYGGMAVLIAREIVRRGATLTATRAFVLVPAVLIASHVFLLTIVPPNLYYGYFVPTAYHNPTQQLNKLFALWIYFIYCAQFLDRTEARLLPTLSAGVLAVLSAVAKPSFLIAFLPTAGLFALGDVLRRRWRQVVLFGIGIAVPVTLVLFLQATFTYGQGTGAGVVFAPFAVFDFTGTLYKLPASLAFPLVVAAFALRSRVHDAKFAFAWMFTAIALFITLFLGEEARLTDGNFAWTGQTAVFLVYVESVLLLVTRADLPRWRQVAWATFGVHVLCGMFWYGMVFSTDWVRWL
jgi:hypothetical protein